jgi:hypothetical protein
VRDEARGVSTIPADCVARLTEALGEKATKAAVKRVGEDLDRLARQAVLDGAPGPDALKIAADRYAKQAELALLIEKRNAALNAMIYAERLAYVRDVWKGREAEGLRALMTGSIEARRGARASVAREQDVLLAQYFEQATTEIERAGLIDSFKSGALDDDVARALWQLNTATPHLDGLPGDAVKIAKAIHRAQEVARADANKAGAWIGKEHGYITRQSHDQYKMERAGSAAWVAAITPRLDWARMEAQHGPIKDRAAWLAETYTNIVSGTHLTAKGATNETGFKGPGNLAKRMSQERVLHFRSADDWTAYNREFGTGNLREAVFRSLRSSAQNTGLMRVLGPNPESMYQRLVDQLLRDVRASGDAQAIRDFQSATTEGGWLDSRLAAVTGKVNMAVNHTLARHASNVRGVQSMAKLGGAVVSSITDLAGYASELSYQGRGFFSGMAEGLGAIVQGRPAGERKEILSSLGVFFDSMIGDITRTGSLDESMGGMVSRGQQRFFKWNLLNWWTETLRGSAALSMSHHLAMNADRAFADLAPELRRVLEQFNIGAADWSAMRKSVRTAEDGRVFMVPDGLEPAQASKLRQYIVDRAETAVLEPDADTRSMLRQGTRPGTITGELLRFMGQFKGFSVGYARQILGREIYGRGGTFGPGSIMGLAQIITTSTLLGYGAMSAKDMLKGKEPRPANDPKTWLKAFTQGGGAGIYGDFLFGEYSRMGQSPTETLAGPAIGTAADVVRLWSKMTRGEADAGDFLRLSLNNAPFMNVFYVRPILDYAILWDVQESIAPGTLRRMERRAQTDAGQTFLLSPANDRLRPFTD